MKNQPVVSNSGTFEDMIFENRNKSYGAYELTRKCRKDLILAFFISLLGFSTAVAVPFIKAFKDRSNPTLIERGITVYIDPVGNDNEVIPPLPPVPPPSTLKQVSYVPPVVVEDAPTDEGLMPISELVDIITNDPPPDIIEIIKDSGGVIVEPEPEPVLYPEEPATFRNGGLNEFRTWVQESVIYPQLALDHKIFGKVVVTFCVNAHGEVVDVKILRSVDPSLDNEAIRVISASPLWKAPRQGGRPVKQLFVIPVVFKMLEQ
jgi:periplasmic protein TonB